VVNELIRRRPYGQSFLAPSAINDLLIKGANHEEIYKNYPVGNVRCHPGCPGLLRIPGVSDLQPRELESCRVDLLDDHLPVLDPPADQGAELEAQNLDEAARLLGGRPSSWREMDAAIEALVLDASPLRSAELLRFLHRRGLRHEFLLGPAMRELEGASVQRLD